MLKKLFTSIGIAGDKGLIGLISEKTGKISFRRSAAILIITGMAIPDYVANGLTWKNVLLTIATLTAVSLSKFFEKE